MAKTLKMQKPMESGKPSHKGGGIASPFFKSALFFLALWALTRYHINITQWGLTSHKPHSVPKCAQVEPLSPIRRSKELDAMESYLTSDGFRDVAIERLAGAVQIPTQSYDDMGEIGEDARWDIFYLFAEYLEKTFPLVHATLQREKVNTHGLLYTWAGSDQALKPNLLMAHQDVVPVPDSTLKQWTHPPFSGHYDGKFVWGRGASDCKNQLLAILNAVEALITADFRPRRTLILSFGFDEEISGGQGAKHLAAHLLSKLGHDSIAAIIDEGAVNTESWGANFAIPGVAEKGYIDVNVVVRMPGGHSSIPPKHNGIGVASEFITLIEANTYEPRLDNTNPYLGFLQCGAEHAPQFPHQLAKLLDKRSSNTHSCSKKHKKDALAMEAAKAGPGIKYLFTTSAAVDIVQGGVKNNALPERTSMTINHRINIGSSSADIKTQMVHLAAQISTKYNLTLHAFDNSTESPNSLTLSHADTVLEPAPITPTLLAASPHGHGHGHGHDSDSDKNSNKNSNNGTTPYAVLAGTTRSLYGAGLSVSPGIMTGNTDTRYYWHLSEHIFRYGPGWDREQEGLGNIHTVDERMGVQGHVDTVRWMVRWVRNVDEAVL